MKLHFESVDWYALGLAVLPGGQEVLRVVPVLSVRKMYCNTSVDGLEHYLLVFISLQGSD